MTTQTSQITGPVQFPLDRFFTFTIRGERGLMETFHHNPARNISRIRRGHYEIDLVYLEAHSFVAQMSDRCTSHLVPEHKKALKYRPSTQALLKIMPQQMLSALTDMFSTVSVNSHPETGEVLPHYFDLNLLSVLTLHSWCKCLKGSELESIIKPLEKEFFDIFTAKLAESYVNYIDADGDRCRLTPGYRSVREVQKKLEAIKAILKSLGYNGAVTKLNAAIKAKRSQ